MKKEFVPTTPQVCESRTPVHHVEVRKEPQSISLQEFLHLVTPSGFPDDNIDMMVQMIIGIAPYTTNRSRNISMESECAQLLIHGGAYLDAMFGPDPHAKAPARILRSRTDRLPFSCLSKAVKTRISNYVPDMDVCAEFLDNTGIEKLRASIQDVIGREPDSENTSLSNGRTELKYRLTNGYIITVLLDEYFGDSQKIVKRLRAKVIFMSDNNSPSYALDLVEDVENREGVRYGELELVSLPQH